MKFFTAMSVVKHVVTPAWVEHSALENKFLGEVFSVLVSKIINRLCVGFERCVRLDPQ